MWGKKLKLYIFQYTFDLILLKLTAQMNDYADGYTLDCLSGLIAGTGGVILLLGLQLLWTTCLPMSMGLCLHC